MITCEICKNSTIEKLLIKNDIIIFRCQNCGFVFADPNRTQNINTIYDQNYFSKDINSELGYSVDYIKEKEAEKRQTAKKDLERISKFKSSGGRLLDVGSATGFFLVEARKKKWQVQGVELSSFAAEYAQKKYSLDTICGKLEDAEFPSNHFDVVTAWDVIEHVTDIQSFIDEVYRVLKPGGLIVLGTPNHLSFGRMIKAKNWAHYRPPEHLSYFSPNTLQLLLIPKFKILKVRSDTTLKSTKLSLGKFILLSGFDRFAFLFNRCEYIRAFALKPNN